MKKIVLFVFVFLASALLLVGCGKKGLAGTWASKEYSGRYVYTFNEDGTGNYDAAGTKMDFTYKIEDDKISILYTGNTAPFETRYTLDGNTLNIVDSFGNDTIYTRK